MKKAPKSKLPRRVLRCFKVLSKDFTWSKSSSFRFFLDFISFRLRLRMPSVSTWRWQPVPRHGGMRLQCTELLPDCSMLADCYQFSSFTMTLQSWGNEIVLQVSHWLLRRVERSVLLLSAQASSWQSSFEYLELLQQSQVRATTVTFNTVAWLFQSSHMLPCSFPCQATHNPPCFDKFPPGDQCLRASFGNCFQMAVGIGFERFDQNGCNAAWRILDAIVGLMCLMCLMWQMTGFQVADGLGV